MSFRLVHSSRSILRSNRLNQTYLQRLQLLSTSTPSNNNETPENSAKHTPVQKTIAATKAYLEKAQSEIKPRLEPYITKLNHASEQLKRLTSDVSDSKEALRRASIALNELTGYDQIDAVKHKVNNQAQHFESTRDKVQEAKRNYESAIATRSSTQRGINELLQRKHLWTGDDVTKFTELYRLEHSHSQEEMLAKDTYQTREKQMDREYMELARSIMERYHEEQLWSDKIRSISTYGTWALMVVNLMLFVAVQTIFEPRKRKRLTDRFEELLVAKVEEEEEKFKNVFESLDEKDRLLMKQQVAVMETLNTLTEHPLFDQETVQFFKASSSLENQKVPTIPNLSPAVHVDNDISERPLSDLVDSEEKSVQVMHQELVEPVLADTTIFHKEPEVNDTLILSKKNLAIYSLESAVAGGLVTAAALYLFR